MSTPRTGVWTEDESKRFRVAMEKFPNGPWSAIADYVGTRTVRQTMTHAQKCRQRLERHARGLKPAGRKRRTPSQDQQIPASLQSPEPPVCVTFEVMVLAELQAPDVPLNPSDFDWVLEYLKSPDWIDLELSDDDLRSLDLVQLEP